MTALDTWLQNATRRLSRDSAAQVRTEIQEHYESAREAAIDGGASSAEADRVAVAALGDATAANCQYRGVLLTASEARLLREGNREARAFCSRPWLRSLLFAISAAALAGALASLLAAATSLAGGLLVIGLGAGFLLAAPFLPIYTPPRARAFRAVKWIALTSALILAFGPEALRWSWLLVSCLWPLAWIEWRRASIRRKLPAAQWPRHLYL